MRSGELTLFAQRTTEPIAAGTYSCGSFSFSYSASEAAPIVRVARDGASANSRRGQVAVELARNAFEGVTLALIRFTDGAEGWYWPADIVPAAG